MRRPLALALGAALLLPACATNPADALSRGIANAISGVDGMLGGGNLPSAHLDALRWAISARAEFERLLRWTSVATRCATSRPRTSPRGATQAS